MLPFHISYQFLPLDFSIFQTCRIALSLRVLPKFPPYLSGFQTQKSGSSSGTFPSLAQRTVCICAAWLRACVQFGQILYPLPGEADDREQSMGTCLASLPKVGAQAPARARVSVP
jgi:hypothetical protein